MTATTTPATADTWAKTPITAPANGRPPLTANQRARLADAVATARAEGDQVEATKAHKAAPKAKTPATSKAAKKASPKEVKEHGPQGAEYTHRVVCCHVVGPKGKRCGTVRWCKPQDAFQVKRCDEHTKTFKRERAKARREAKAKANAKG